MGCANTIYLHGREAQKKEKKNLAAGEQGRDKGLKFWANTANGIIRFPSKQSMKLIVVLMRSVL